MRWICGQAGFQRRRDLPLTFTVPDVDIDRSDRPVAFLRMPSMARSRYSAFCHLARTDSAIFRRCSSLRGLRAFSDICFRNSGSAQRARSVAEILARVSAEVLFEYDVICHEP